MSLIRRPSPFGEMLSLRQAMDRLFEDSFVRPPAGTGSDSALAIDVYSSSDALVIEAALPGVKQEDLDISLLGETLTISASNRQEQERDEEGYSYREIRRGTFSRTISLPSGLNAEGATASFDNGLLRLSIPKAEESRPRQIRITPSSNGSQQAASGQVEPAEKSDEAGR